MSHHRLLSLAAIPLVSAVTFAQPVISAHSGLIQHFEGAVFLDERPLLEKAGKFEQMNDGSVLRTGEGRVEISLTPGVFLRLGDHSGIHMVSNHLADTRLRFLYGSAIVDVSSDPIKDTAPALRTPVTVLVDDYQVSIAKEGRYRLNHGPAELKVDRGEARVQIDGHSTAVGAGYALPMEKHQLVATRFTPGNGDGLDNWNKARNDSITEDNLEAAHTGDLSGQIDSWQNDRDSYLEALGMSSYLPPLPLSTYTPLLGSAVLGVTPMGLFGAGYGGMYGIYSYPYLRYYPGAVYGIYGQRPGIIVSPGRIGAGIRPIYPSSLYGAGRPPTSVHVPSPVYSPGATVHAPPMVRSPAPIAHPGVVHGGAVHVGGGRR